MITSSRTTSLTPVKSGGFRANYEYTLSDGRKISRGPLNVVSELDATSKRTSMEPAILSSIQVSDAEDAVSNNIKTSNKFASLQQVQLAWLRAGFNEDEPYKAFSMMKAIGRSLLSLGLTDAKNAELLNSSLEDAVAARIYFESLDANSSVLEAYEAVSGGLK